MSPAEKQELIKAIGTFVCGEIARGLEPVRAELLRLSVELKQAELVVRELRYAGVWTDRASYKRGNFVTHSGSLWHCNLDDVHTMPGSDVTAWTLCVKRGEDRTKAA
jgi:hypothetical protein